MADLFQKIEAFVRVPRLWAWGGTEGEDCTTFIGSWCRHLTGTDPAAALRGTYSDAVGAVAIVASYGGMAGVGEAFLTPLGARLVTDISDGDIGILKGAMHADGQPIGIQEIPGIAFGPMWVVMTQHGVRVTRLRFAGPAWRLVP